MRNKHGQYHVSQKNDEILAKKTYHEARAPPRTTAPWPWNLIAHFEVDVLLKWEKKKFLRRLYKTSAQLQHSSKNEKEIHKNLNSLFLEEAFTSENDNE